MRFLVERDVILGSGRARGSTSASARRRRDADRPRAAGPDAGADGRRSIACVSLHCPRVAVGVIGMTVRVDHVRHHQTLFGRAGNERLWRVRGIDQDRASGGAIAEEIPEVPIAAGADLFEDQLHGAL